ncbi:MerR family transcriptional regulator [Pseudonocardia spinosispora]|uniref:MerR family transcriptional regulator n=1 Tax=Pseudonocardia spinosispora TaxID=103441 RepID=UPI000409C85A|nr:MerR family transcriptional regulator [Pseudonocardia spinosispora]
MRIGELATRTGVSRRSLRYYEQHELLSSERTSNGWRTYDEAAVRRVRSIADLLKVGLTIEGVKQLVPCLEQDDVSVCEDPGLALRMYEARLAVFDQRLAELQHHRDQLATLVTALRAGESGALAH